MNQLQSKYTYVPIDRLVMLETKRALPQQDTGTVLFVDISGSTALTEYLYTTHGMRRGAELIAQQLNAVYDGLVNAVMHFGGSVLGFAGDSMLCWFGVHHIQDFRQTCLQAVACAHTMQQVMQELEEHPILTNIPQPMAVKIAIASGPVRRAIVGDPQLQIIDILFGRPVNMTATGEHLSNRGEILLEEESVDLVAEAITVLEWRNASTTPAKFAVVHVQEPETGIPDSFSWPPRETLTIPDAEIRNWLLPIVNRQLASGLREYLTELRTAVALFMGISGIDLDHDENAGQLMNEAVCWGQQITQRYGGNVLQVTTGDKGSYLYAAFGAPAAYEDNAYRAVAAALELSHPPEHLGIEIRLGISQGLMRTGAYGGLQRRTYGVLGDEVNIAARLMQRAKAGEVILSGTVAKLVSEDFSVDVFDPISMKGKTQKMLIASLKGTRNQIDVVNTYTTELAGRSDVLVKMLEQVQPVFSGQFAGMSIIYGEAGMGKTRLIHEVRQHVARHGEVDWLTAAADEILSLAFNPFVSLLRNLFELRPDHTPAQNLTRFQAGIQQAVVNLEQSNFPNDSILADDLRRTQGDLALLLGLTNGEQAIESVSTQARLENTITGLIAVILAQVTHHPLVLCIEDIHWLDTASHRTLSKLVQTAAQRPLWLLFSSRYVEDTPAFDLTLGPNTPQYTINLQHLSVEAVSEIAANLLGGMISPRLAMHLRDQTNGNPFFVEQMLLDLQERGLLEQAVNGWQIIYTSDVEVPDKINQVLVARLDRLPAKLKAVVQTASVLGQEFDVQVLTTMLHKLPVNALLRSGTQAGIWFQASDAVYSFRHALLRDAAYVMQTDSRLQAMHRSAAEIIQQVYQNDVSQAVVLVEHWHRAGDIHKEIAYAQTASQQAVAVSDFQTARRIGERALKHVGHITPETQIVLLKTVSKATFHLSNFSVTRQYLDTAHDLITTYQQSEHLPEVQYQLGRLMFEQGDVDAATTYFTETLTLAETANDQIILANALNGLGDLEMSEGNYSAAQTYYRRSIDISRSLNNLANVVNSLNTLALAEMRLGSPENASKMWEECHQLCMQIGLKDSAVSALINLAYVTVNLKNFVDAKAYSSEALKLSYQINNRARMAVAHQNLGAALNGLGEKENAIHHLFVALGILHEIGAVPRMIVTLGAVANMWVETGQYENALLLLGCLLHDEATSPDSIQFLQQSLDTEMRPVLNQHLDGAAIDDILLKGSHLQLKDVVPQILEQRSLANIDCT